MAKSVSISAPVKILSATQAASDIFKHPGGIGVFIGLRGHAGGEWSLFAEFPDETQSSSTPQHSQTCTGLFYSYERSRRRLRSGRINYLPAPTAAS